MRVSWSGRHSGGLDDETFPCFARFVRRRHVWRLRPQSAWRHHGYRWERRRSRRRNHWTGRRRRHAGERRRRDGVAGSVPWLDAVPDRGAERQRLLPDEGCRPARRPSRRRNRPLHGVADAVHHHQPGRHPGARLGRVGLHRGRDPRRDRAARRRHQHASPAGRFRSTRARPRRRRARGAWRSTPGRASSSRPTTRAARTSVGSTRPPGTSSPGGSRARRRLAWWWRPTARCCSTPGMGAGRTRSRGWIG